jgi:starch phosphorylase
MLLLERKIIPALYERDAKGVPTAWVARIRESMARLTPRFSADPVVREETERHYLPAAAAYRRRAADQGQLGAEVEVWRQRLEKGWPRLRFGDLSVTRSGSRLRFDVQIYLGDLPATDVEVELSADPSAGEGTATRIAMARGRPLEGAVQAFLYPATVDTST